MEGAWLVVGPGRCGLQVARSLQAAGVPLSGVVARGAAARKRARRNLPGVPVTGLEADWPRAWGLLLAVPDRELPGLAALLSPRLDAGVKVVLHTSGALSAEVLAPLRTRGRVVGSLHPLMAFSRSDGPLISLAGVTAAVEGDRAAVRVARALTRRLGMRPLVLAPEDKPLYHAVAALAANLTYTLVAVACAELATLGSSRHQAAAALRPLVIRAVTGALDAAGFSRLTGPLARGDSCTIRTHLGVLPRPVALAYAHVARLAIDGLQAEALVSPAALAEMTAALTSPQWCDSFGVVRLGEEG